MKPQVPIRDTVSKSAEVSKIAQHLSLIIRVQSLEPTQWKKKTDFYRISSILHRHAMAHVCSYIYI